MFFVAEVGVERGLGYIRALVDVLDCYCLVVFVVY